MLISRRGTLLGLAAVGLGPASAAFARAPGDRRFVVILLRGAMDGLSALQPYGDADFAGLRGPLALPPPGQKGGLLDCGGFYGLHPALSSLHALYAQGDVLFVHAVAGHYRSRSHFEAQDFLESGADQRLSSGWLNRAALALGGNDLALSVGLSAPLLLRGPARVEAWAPEHFSGPSDELFARIADLNAHDPVIGPALAEGIARRGLAAEAGSDPHAKPADFATLAGAAGRLLAAPDGPRLAALELDGWDTHAAQLRRLDQQFRLLDGGIAALKAGLGDDAWRETVVLAVTEFGRTARANGTGGTDHGTAGVAILAGGAVAGGRVRADWPGLSGNKLFENRDLAPTGDVRALAKGILTGHLRLPGSALASVFPGSDEAAPAAGLLRA